MDTVLIYNTVRSNSETLKARLPEGTTDNIAEVNAAMLDGENVAIANEFIHTLLNKVVKTYVHNKSFKNPMKPLKKGKKPLGDTVEEIYVNFIKAKQYDQAGNELLKRELPDVKTVYHRQNSELKYKVTISRAKLKKAFVSWANFEAFINEIISKLESSAELDEFTLTKELITTAIDNKALKVIPIKDPLASKENAEAFIKTIKSYSGLMAFPSANYNAYLEAQDKDKVPLITFTRLDEQVLIIDTITNTSVAVDVLAAAFNMSVVEFNNTKKIIIDTFPNPDIKACLVDEAFFQIYDDLYTIASFNNGEGLYDNYWLHVWNTYAYSILCNGLVFMVTSDTDSDGQHEIFSVTYDLAEGATSSNKRTSANEGGSYSTTISGADSVTVTMGGSAVDDAYNAESGKIVIESVTGDIVITATVAG